MYYTKRVYPDDDLQKRSKYFAPLNTYTLSCVDCYYVVINLKRNEMSKLKNFLGYLSSNLTKLGSSRYWHWKANRDNPMLIGRLSQALQ